MKFERPSKIQAISLPMILTPPYKNLIAQAHNGSGKTTCFVLGMLSRVDPKLQVPQALCICPTRELAIQNLEVLRKMGKHTGIESECAIPMDSANYTSISQRPPVKAQVVIGTPVQNQLWVFCYTVCLGVWRSSLKRDSVDGWLVSGNYSPDKPGAYDMDISSNYIPFTEGREGTLETLPIMIYIWDFVAVGLSLHTTEQIALQLSFSLDHVGESPVIILVEVWMTFPMILSIMIYILFPNSRMQSSPLMKMVIAAVSHP
ncbi:DEAD-box ATP-dependent RNA helicase 38 [Vitis vinifera]|uniref:DEAD-box ATP-dependent RNA helicase 38 n=1 Tax=Vitis vinifera TaxID=29760 RepID=A0A438EJT3_VITVI|nr:DEAD-box ATP-dependent RNA helicase 38 [Vitis vinifera]